MKLPLVKAALAMKRSDSTGGAIPGLRSTGRGRRTTTLVVAGLLVLAGLALGIGGNAGVLAQQAPPPTIRTLHAASIPVSGTPRQYDMMQMLLELAPGAEVPSHRVNGKAIITVVTGEIARIEEDGGTTVFRAGQTFPESAEDEFDVDRNNGNTPARLLATFLLVPGAEPLIFNPNRPSNSPGPTFIAVARTTTGTIPADFTLSHSMFEVLPGFSLASHTHDGWHLLTHISGTVTNRVNGVVQPATFAHGPHDFHEAANSTSVTATAISASINPVGVPPLRLVGGASTPQQPQQAIRPPSTGDAGLTD